MEHLLNFNFLLTLFLLIISISILFFLNYIIYINYKKKHLNKKESIILFFSYILLIIFYAVPTEFLYYSLRTIKILNIYIDKEIFIGLMTFGQYSILISIILFILFKYFSIQKNANIDKYESEVEKNHIVNLILKDILSKDKFFTLFNTTLPVGQKDEKLGIDYIPFMLNAIQKNKEEFDKKANSFLNWSIKIGSIFILGIFLFAYIIINNSSLSFASSMEKLRQENQSLQVALSKTTKESISEILRDKNVNIDTINLRIITKLDTSLNSTKNLLGAIKYFKRNANLFNLNNSFSNNKNILYDLGFEKEVDEIETLTNNQEILNAQLTIYTSNINNLINKAEIEIDKPQNQTNELIKRVSIGLIVSSFMFGILRFLIKQYQSNISNKNKCEEDDLIIRRLYIGLKVSNPANDERKIFMQKLLEFEKEDTKNENNLSSEEAGIIKDVINAILKKLG